MAKVKTLVAAIAITLVTLGLLGSPIAHADSGIQPAAVIGNMR